MEYLKSLVDIYPVFMGIFALIAIVFYLNDIRVLLKMGSKGYELKYKVLMAFICGYFILRGIRYLGYIS